jgi:hypothetical protein
MTKQLAHFYEFSDDNAGLAAAAILVVYLAAAVIYTVTLPQELRFADERLYYRLAENVWKLGMFSSNGALPTAERAPGFALLIAPLIPLEHSITFARLLNFVMVGAAGMLGFRLLVEHDNPVAGLIYMAVLLFYPVAFFTAGTLYPQSLSIFLLVALSYLLLSRRRGYGRLILAGLAYGLLILTAPVFLALIPAFGWAVYRGASAAGRGPIQSFGLFVLIAALVNAPWVLRNYKAFDQFVFVSANSGLMLILGNSENARYDLGPRTDIQVYRDYAVEHSSNPAQYDMQLREQAIDWIAENPRRAAVLYLQKLGNWFHFRNKLATESEMSVVRDMILLASYYPLLALAICFLLFDRTRRLLALKVYVLLLYLGGAAFYAIFFTRIRYRIPFDATMLFLAAMQIEVLVRSLMTHSEVGPFLASAGARAQRRRQTPPGAAPRPDRWDDADR